MVNRSLLVHVKDVITSRTIADLASTRTPRKIEKRKKTRRKNGTAKRKTAEETVTPRATETILHDTRRVVTRLAQQGS